MAEGLYRIGECIYMEVFPPPTPYQICKIEELRKNSKGSVEVAAKCFFRRKDLPPNLLIAADRHAMAIDEDNEMDSTIPHANNFNNLSELQKHQSRHRELFLSRQIETYKIDMVRGKCSVSLLNELENISTYLEREDTFFYTMVYDPNQKTLLVDKGEIRVGLDYQAVVPPYTPPSAGVTDADQIVDRLWEPLKMPDHRVEQFLVVARSIGTFARALLDGAKKPQISLRLGAAAASRDITLFHAMDTLHQSVYDVNTATSRLVPRGPVLCADELESWTQEEAKRFEEGLQDQKDFLYIQRRYLPWKSLKSIVSYYYMWKTTDRYQIQKRHRMIEKQNDLKEVIVHLRTPSGAPPSGHRDLSGKAASAGDMIPPNNDPKTPVPQVVDGEKGCESCLGTVSARWVSWGPAHEHCRLCGHCYIYWRKYGGLKLATRWEAVDKRTVHPSSLAGLVMKKTNRDHRPRVGKKGMKLKGDSSDIVPPLPFYMRPSGVILYMRKKLGGATLLRTARSSWSRPINTQTLDKATPAEIQQAVVAHSKKGQRRQKESTLANLKQALSSPPKQFRLHPSPMPISPSYRSKVPKSKSSIVASSGIFIPPSSAQITTSSQQPVLAQGPPLVPSTIITHQQVSTSGTFVPPGKSDGKEHEERSPLLTSVGSSAPRKRTAEDDEGGPAVKQPCTSVLPGEIFFKSNEKLKQARTEFSHNKLVKLARHPTKTPFETMD